MSSVKVNPAIARARSRATFDPLELTQFIDGGAEQTERRRYVQKYAIREAAKEGFKNYSGLSREELYEEALRKTVFYHKHSTDLKLGPLDDLIFKEVFFPCEVSPFALHHGMFIPTIQKLGTEEQKAKWLPLAETHEILGTYAQTELGHGSFLRGLETVASYDPSIEEFIIDTPTVTSTKFWPGALGKTSNFCVVMARLILKGRDCGMQSFLVQLRDLKTHIPLPGISVGDIGTKFGYGQMDNGFLRLNKVRIPRENMLMRYSKVLEDGTFVRPKNDRLVYGAMTLVRAQISVSCGRTLAKAVTIAIRYSTVRYQSEINAGQGEVPVLDFQTQQHKLFVQLATAYALTLAALESFYLYVEVSSQIEDGNLEQLPLLHCISSGLKAFSSWAMAHGVEQCRFACGGHGYLMASGIPKMYVNEIPSCTYEGENTVLALQVARYTNKSFEAVEKGDSVPQGIQFLANRESKSKLTDALELDHIITAFEHRATVMIAEANRRMKDLIQNGMKPAEAWNNSSQALAESAMAFCHAYVVRVFIEAVEGANLSPAIAKVMTQLCQLYAASGIVKDAGQFLKGGFMTTDQIDIVQSKVYDLLAEIRPNAVVLVDAFDYPDEVLDSALGRYDGNVYEALMESARNSKLNEKEVHDGIFKYVKPYVKYLKEQKGLQARL